MELSSAGVDGDLDALEELKLSRGYSLVRKRIECEIERMRDNLEQDSDLPAAAGIRGYIRALRMVLQLPLILRAEIIRREGNLPRQPLKA